MRILVTGGAGYIGSHTVVELLSSNHDVIILDNFSNSKYKCIEQIKKITSKNFITLIGDVADKDLLQNIFKENTIDAVIHFAGYKSVSESQSEPLKYYQNNIMATLNLLHVMRENKVHKFIFSSSATVYGEPESLPLSETNKVGGTTNPYGTSKLFVEQILQDVSLTEDFDIVCLRYFNPVGAHSSGDIGESPNGAPNNLVPYLLDVACGIREHIYIYGTDYPTHDGTGVRDFIHVVDLAKGHLSAIKYLENKRGYHVFNLGTGKGYSVLELISTFEKIANLKINKILSDRRAGDIASCWANPQKANDCLNWKAEKNLDDMLIDAWNWKRKYPDGFNF
ncbi:UDP-glucose 4-epimerase GalE [Salmonella enterica subsp. houtenae]|nr:UDP-glucose 4-epimerase GalE [Salmonella enterica]ECD9549436.1 UDP-glucose 4-epimerase GalE [Salmonella enterica subsp. houtenae]EBN4823316.1 UDP-glucose 4-epimerase GalE [Salmonella enterica]EDR3245389.1 UDP-glucose 4-epimerase GalE [Salmonella enterica subsp. houtenae]EDW0111626.1 UDP-glucose 4-epimerase GalE [Salmonella enterica]